MDSTSNYFELLRFCLNEDLPVPSCIKDINWHDLLVFATKHAIPGIFLPTILMENGRLGKDDFMGNKPSDEDVMEWVFEGHRLKKNNTTLFGRTVKASEWFLENGFRNCILKGQGNALMYPEPYMRSCGDIDIWLEGGREKILAFTNQYYSGRKASSIHVDFPMFRDAEVEVHFRPTYLLNPFLDKKLKKYFEEVAEEQFTNKITSPDGKYSFNIPTNTFNLFFQLLHIYRHIIKEGIGLRQIIDYYYLLRKAKSDGMTDADKNELIKTLKRFRLLKFAKAMMYIEQSILGLDSSYLYVEPNEKEGKFIINEVLEAGNFGKYETRMNESMKGAHGHVKRFIILESFHYRLLLHYPSESFWVPFYDFRGHLRRRFKDDAIAED